MREMITGEIIFVESEPGDGTHYSYAIVNKNGWRILAIDSDFRFPKRFADWEVSDLFGTMGQYAPLAEKALALSEDAEAYNCNPFTLVEVVTTIAAIMRGEI
jgi:hypothetical protein